MPLTELKRFSTTLFKDKNPADEAQVPADGANVDVYYRGATTSQSQSWGASPDEQNINVYDIGSLAVNDTIQIGTTTNPTFTVMAINSATQVRLRNNDATPRSLGLYDRLLVQQRRPTVYRDVTGTSVLAAGVTFNASDRGLVEFFSNERFFDYIVSGTGVTTTLYQEGESGQVWAGRTYYDVRSFKDVATAIATVPAHSVLVLPAAGGPYTPPTADGWTINKPLVIMGDNERLSQNETTELRFFTTGGADGARNSNIFKLTAGANFVTIKQFVMGNGAGQPSIGGTGCGVIFDENSLIQNLTLEKLNILYSGLNGIKLTPGFYTNYVVGCNIKDVNVYGSISDGIALDTITLLHMEDVMSIANKAQGIYITACSGAVLERIAVENNCTLLADSDAFGHININNSHAITMVGGHVENFAAGGGNVRTGVLINACRGGMISGYFFYMPTPTATSRSILLYNGTNSFIVGSNQHSTIDIAVEIGPGVPVSSGCVVMPQSAFITSAPNARCRVILPTDGRNFALLNNMVAAGTDNNGAGILLPAVPDVATLDVSIVQDGLIVYDTTANKFKGRANGAWVDLH